MQDMLTLMQVDASHQDDLELVKGLRVALENKQVNSGIPSGRFGQSCTVVGDLLVLFGGINDHGIRQNDTWTGQVMYDETSNG